MGVANYSRVLEVNPKTNKIAWEYKDRNTVKFRSPVAGGAQRLPNGNTLICESTKGLLFEVTRDKQIVWEFVSPFYIDCPRGEVGWTNLIFRSQRYGPDYKGLKGKDLDPDKFEWVLQEKGKPTKTTKVSSTEQEEAARARLKALGY